MGSEHYEAEIARKDKRIQDLEIALRQSERSREKDLTSYHAREAARAEGVQESAIVDVETRAIDSGLFKIDSRGRLVRFENGGPVLNSDGKPGSVHDWVRDQRPTAPHWWGHPAQTEGKDPVVNPWSKEHWNLTEQGQVFQHDPARARRLAAAAGKTIKE